MPNLILHLARSLTRLVSGSLSFVPAVAQGEERIDQFVGRRRLLRRCRRGDLPQERLFLNLVAELENDPFREASTHTRRASQNPRILGKDCRGNGVLSELADQRETHLWAAALYAQE